MAGRVSPSVGFMSKLLQLRKEVFEFGLLPLSTLLPRLDGPNALQVRLMRTMSF